jgi:hypothetical protein
MKSYPSIPSNPKKLDREYIVFDKLDGSNIRAEWSKKRGFYKFGSRNQLLSEEQTILYPSIDLIKEKYEESIRQSFINYGVDRGICFFEYFGLNSFAGSHTDPVDEMNIVIIDVNPYKKGIIPPEEFLDFTQGMDIPNVVLEGKLTPEIINDIRNGRLDGMTSIEGVVAKAKGIRHNGMVKIKTYQWLDKLKTFCNNDEKLFNRLK